MLVNQKTRFQPLPISTVRQGSAWGLRDGVGAPWSHFAFLLDLWAYAGHTQGIRQGWGKRGPDWGAGGWEKDYARVVSAPPPTIVQHRTRQHTAVHSSAQ